MPKISELSVNGIKYRVDVDAETSLLTLLRDELDITGPKYGCGEGQCGACTVLLDGVPKRSCITTVEAAREKQITTIEGLAQNGHLHPIQQAFLNLGAMQCGYCSSGMIMTAFGLLKTHPNPTELEIVHFMQGNICRCGTYRRIIAAVQQAARVMKEARS